MDLSVVAATEDDRPVLRRLIELCRYDFSEFDEADVDAGGEYGYRYLDSYWTEPDRTPLLFRVDGRWAGFGLVRALERFDMAEFFVLRKYRRQGIGRRAAVELFRRFPGPWAVRQLKTNPAATAFWQRAIPFDYSESSTDEEITQTFDSSLRFKAGQRSRTGAPPGTLVIRPAVDADLPAILRLWTDAAAEPTNTDNLDALHTLVCHDHDALLVAEAAGALVGTVISAWDGWRGSIYRLVVHPDHRRKGVGRQLLDSAEASLADRGSRRAQIFVVESDERAMGFWSSTLWQPQQDRRRFVRG